MDRIKRRYGVDREVGKTERREQPTQVQLQGSFILAEMVTIAARVYVVEPGTLMERQGRCREGRRLLLMV